MYYVCVHVRKDAWMDGGREGRREGGMDGCVYIYMFMHGQTMQAAETLSV